MNSFAWYSVLRCLKAFCDAIPEWECKTVGNGHPDDLHCFTCTFYDLRRRVNRAYSFWSKGDRYKDAAS